MSEMIERMARAMEPSAFRTYDKGFTTANTFARRAFLNAERTVKAARRKARNALGAIREQTEATINAGIASLGRDDDRPAAVVVDDLWRAMVDATLSDDEVSAAIEEMRG